MADEPSWFERWVDELLNNDRFQRLAAKILVRYWAWRREARSRPR